MIRAKIELLAYRVEDTDSEYLDMKIKTIKDLLKDEICLNEDSISYLIKIIQFDMAGRFLDSIITFLFKVDLKEPKEDTFYLMITVVKGFPWCDLFYDLDSNAIKAKFYNHRSIARCLIRGSES